jgi:hypothetical protein
MTRSSQRIEPPPNPERFKVRGLPGAGFWRTVQKAIERSDWTVRLIAIMITIGAVTALINLTS